MHDANGTELKVGDKVMIECVITELYQGEEFCNVSLVTTRPMRGNDQPDTYSAVNTGQLVLLERPQQADATQPDNPAPGE